MGKPSVCQCDVHAVQSLLLLHDVLYSMHCITQCSHHQNSCCDCYHDVAEVRACNNVSIAQNSLEPILGMKVCSIKHDICAVQRGQYSIK